MKNIKEDPFRIKKNRYSPHFIHTNNNSFRCKNDIKLDISKISDSEYFN